MSELLDSAKQAVTLARRKGVTEVAANAYRSRNVEVTWRDGKLEKLSDATTRGVSLQLYVDGRYSTARSIDLRPAAFEKFVEEAISMARTLSVDEHRRLPDPKLYEGRTKADLQLVDTCYTRVTAAERRARAKALEDGVRAADPRSQLISVTSWVGDSGNDSALVHSNGFEDEQHDTYFYMDVSATARDPDGRRPEEDAFACARVMAEIPPASEMGALAAQRAFARIGAKKSATAVLPMIVENRTAGRLIGTMLRCLSGRALQQKQSFYEGKLGKAIANTCLGIHDEPHLAKGIGSRAWDSDGIAAKRFAVVDRGVLKDYYIDNYYGRKLGRSPTTGGASNVIFAAGKKNADELLASVKHGMLVTGFLGGNSNDTTGDLSLGVQGFVIRNGTRAEPFSEMNIAGNQATLWKKLVELGNDPYPYSNIRVPTLLFTDVQFSGV